MTPLQGCQHRHQGGIAFFSEKLKQRLLDRVCRDLSFPTSPTNSCKNYLHRVLYGIPHWWSINVISKRTPCLNQKFRFPDEMTHVWFKKVLIYFWSKRLLPPYCHQVVEIMWAPQPTSSWLMMMSFTVHLDLANNFPEWSTKTVRPTWITRKDQPDPNGKTLCVWCALQQIYLKTSDPSNI